MERRATQPDKRTVQYLWMVERASDRILMTWTPASGGVFMIVVSHIGTTPRPSFAEAVETVCHGMQSVLCDTGSLDAVRLGAH